MKLKTLRVLSALGHESRLDIFRELIQAGPSGLPAGEIVDKLGIPAPTCSFHLKELRSAEVVVSERQGRSILYYANFPRLQAALNYILEDCCSGQAGQLTNPKREGT